MKKLLARVLRTLSVSLAGAALAAGASAQEWSPTKPIQMIVPYTPGGGVDTVFNVIMPVVSQRLGQPILLMHKPGASTIVGMQALAQAQPDGYTIGFLSDQTVVLQLGNKLPFKLSELEPVTQLLESYFVIAAGEKTGFRSLKDMIAAAKAQPGKITYASPGTGSPHHLMMENFSQAAGIQLTHVPYQGAAKMLTDTIAGHVDSMLVGAVTAVEYAKNGQLVPLAVMSPARLPSAPELPTTSEAGVPGFSSSYWWAIAAPKGTPPAAVARLNKEIVGALNTPDVQRKLISMHLIPKPSTPAELARLMKSDEEKYATIIRRSKIQLQ